MQYTVVLAGLFSLALVTAPVVQPAPQHLDPVGSYAIVTADEEGMPLAGTLTVRAGADGEFVGQFAATGSTEPVPVLQVTTNGRHLMAFLETGSGLGVTWLERQEDGTFTGSWHVVGAGIRVTATKRSGRSSARGGARELTVRERGTTIRPVFPVFAVGPLARAT
jgi:hypothetical protein